MPVLRDLDVGTPILDSGVLPRKKDKSIVAALFGLLVGASLVLVLVSEANSAAQRNNPTPGFVFAGYVFAIFASLIVHEFGHLLAGWIVGFRFSSIAIGPLALFLQYGRLRLQIRKTLPAGGHAGMHIDRIRRLRRRLSLFIVAGPAANLACCSVTAISIAYIHPSGDWSTFLRLFRMIGLVFGVGNLVPFRIGAMFPDGARLWMLISSRTKTKRWFSLNALNAQSHGGARPSLYRRTRLKAASGIADQSVDDFAGNWAAYIAANDRKDSRAAAVHLEKCLALAKMLGPSLQDVIAVEAAVFTAWFGENARLSEKWFAQVKKFKAISPLTQIRAETALLCARKEFDSALGHLEGAFAFVEKLPPTAIKTMLSQGLTEWRQEICERQRSLNLITEDVSSIPVSQV
jgi:hypothetical protein